LVVDASALEASDVGIPAAEAADFVVPVVPVFPTVALFEALDVAAEDIAEKAVPGAEAAPDSCSSSGDRDRGGG
jgi:hypothetical protein